MCFSAPAGRGRTQEIIFIFEADFVGAIKNACVNDWYSSAIHLARAANIVKKGIFEHRYSISGFFYPK